MGLGVGVPGDCMKLVGWPGLMYQSIFVKNLPLCPPPPTARNSQHSFHLIFGGLGPKAICGSPRGPEKACLKAWASIWAENLFFGVVVGGGVWGVCGVGGGNSPPTSNHPQRPFLSTNNCLGQPPSKERPHANNKQIN